MGGGIAPLIDGVRCLIAHAFLLGALIAEASCFEPSRFGLQLAQQ